MPHPPKKPDGSVVGDSRALMHGRIFMRDLPPDWFETTAWLARLQFVRIWLRAYERATTVRQRQALTRAVWRALFPPRLSGRLVRFVTAAGRTGHAFSEARQKPQRGRPILRTQQRVRAVLDAHNIGRELGTDLLDYLALLPRAARQPGPGRPRRPRPK